MRKTHFIKDSSIRTRLRRSMLVISLVALLGMGIAGLISILIIRGRCEDLVMDQTSRIFSDLMSSRTNLVESKLMESRRFLIYMANYVHELYVNEDKHKRIPLDMYNNDEPGTLTMQFTIQNESIDLEATRDERELLANTQYVIKPSMVQEDCDVVAVYLGTESGQMLCFDAHPENKARDKDGRALPYDYKNSLWYMLAKEKKEPVYTDVYTDNFGKGPVITCAAPLFDENDEFCGVIGMDLLIADVYRMSIPDLTEDEVTSLLLDTKGNLISPDGLSQTIYDQSGLSEATISRILNTEGELIVTDSGRCYMSRLIPLTNWRLCLSMPEEVILGTVREMEFGIMNTIISFVGIFFAIIIIIAVFSKRMADGITGPILELGKDVEEMSTGNLMHRAVIREDDEIGELAEKFNDMAINLKRRMDDVTALNEEKSRVESEFYVAARMQREVLPSRFPAFPGRSDFDIYASMSPARDVGGDFYDFFMVDDNHLALVIADVSGKGILAAMFMMTTRTLIKSNAQPGVSPSQILYRTNNQLCEDNNASLFVTAWLGILDLASGVITAVNAGHEYPAFMHDHKNFKLVETENNPPLASTRNIEFNEYELSLSPGDILFLYTDGVTDEKGAARQRYGLERMLSILNSNRRSSCEEITGTLMGSIRSFAADADHFDDITLLCLKYYGKEGALHRRM